MRIIEVKTNGTKTALVNIDRIDFIMPRMVHTIGEEKSREECEIIMGPNKVYSALTATEVKELIRYAKYERQN